MSLNSWSFMLLATSAVVGLPLVPAWLRLPLLLAANAAFAGSHWGAAAPVALAFCLAGYGCARLVAGRGPGVTILTVAALTAVFVWLRGYSAADLVSGAAVAAPGAWAFAGLSFLFFKMVHFVVDSSGQSVGALSLGRYLAYCTNFTTLLMGPIQRYQDFDAQLGSPTLGALSYERRVDYLNRVLRGLLKAFTLAPWLQPFILTPGTAVDQLAPADLLLRTYSFYVYLYLDFSGYCDIVIGTGGLMGITPPENFRFPFLARDVGSYWLRVHRSLTLWLTDYVFTPTYRALQSRLSRPSFGAVAAALMVTMVISGIWHGTTLNFVIFGAVHGLALIVARGYEQLMVAWLGRAGFRRFAERPLVTVLSFFVTYNFTSLAYALFALGAADAGRLYARLAMALLPGTVSS